MKKLDRRKFWLAFTVSTMVFFCFAAPAVYFAMRTHDARDSAQAYYDELAAHATDCSGQASQEDCAELAKRRLTFERAAERAENLRSATGIFTIFAIFVPLIIWGGYFLTRAVFYDG